MILVILNKLKDIDMRKLIVAGNWKMNNTISEGEELIKSLLSKYKKCENQELIIIPPFVLLDKAQQLVQNSCIKVGAQNCAKWEKGAYTGEISAEMIKALQVKYVTVGHSERRTYFKETTADLKDKVDICLKNQLKPIFCIGETLDERQKGIHFDIIKSQIEESLFHLSKEDFQKNIIAYEPVWAIGTGVTASSDQAQEIHKYIRGLIKEKYDEEAAENTTILYGGSCNPKNAKELFSQPDIDGGLIGGASLKADDFIAIYDSF